MALCGSSQIICEKCTLVKMCHDISRRRYKFHECTNSKSLLFGITFICFCSPTFFFFFRISFSPIFPIFSYFFLKNKRVDERQEMVAKIKVLFCFYISVLVGKNWNRNNKSNNKYSYEVNLNHILYNQGDGYLVLF